MCISDAVPGNRTVLELGGVSLLGKGSRPRENIPINGMPRGHVPTSRCGPFGCQPHEGPESFPERFFGDARVNQYECEDPFLAYSPLGAVHSALFGIWSGSCRIPLARLGGFDRLERRPLWARRGEGGSRNIDCNLRGSPKVCQRCGQGPLSFALFGIRQDRPSSRLRNSSSIELAGEDLGIRRMCALTIRAKAGETPIEETI